MQVRDGVLDVVENCNQSATPNAHFKSWFTQNFHWIFCRCGTNSGSFGVIIWNRAFS